MDKSYSFEHRYSVGYRSPVEIPDTIQTKRCRRCGAEFQTLSRIKKRCDPCQAAADITRKANQYQALKARRKARRTA